MNGGAGRNGWGTGEVGTVFSGLDGNAQMGRAVTPLRARQICHGRAVRRPSCPAPVGERGDRRRQRGGCRSTPTDSDRTQPDEG